MKIKIPFFTFLPIIFFLSCCFAKDSSIVRSALTAQKKIFVIPVEGDVEPAMAEFISRSLREAAQYPDALFILEMDTFGGRVDAAFQIVDTILNAPRGRTIAFVKTKAISAGSLIACDEAQHYNRLLRPDSSYKRRFTNAWRKISVAHKGQIPHACKTQRLPSSPCRVYGKPRNGSI